MAPHSHQSHQTEASVLSRFRVPALLLAAGAILLLVGLPLTWSTVSSSDGSVSVPLRGLDYAGYDIATTVVLAALLIGAGAAQAAGDARARSGAVILALFAALWAVLVFIAAANPSADGISLSGLRVSVGIGAYVVATGAVVALAGGILGLRSSGSTIVVRGKRQAA
jgi:hypothetical protein